MFYSQAFLMFHLGIMGAKYRTIPDMFIWGRHIQQPYDSGHNRVKVVIT